MTFIPMEQSILSSPLIFFYKYMFTTAYSTALAFWALQWLNSSFERLGQWPFVACGAIGMVSIWWMCGGLKRVELNGTTLVISNYLSEICVPVQEIAGVKQNRLLNIRPITLRFKSETPFGRSITFIPPSSLRKFSEDPLVKRLRYLATLKSS